MPALPGAAVFWAALLGYLGAAGAAAGRSAELGRGALLATEPREPLSLAALQVGTTPRGADVVARGEVLPGWSPESPAAVAASETRTRLWASLRSPELGAWGGAPLPEGSVVAASADPTVASARIARSPSEQLALEVLYECRRAGVARVDLSFGAGAPRRAARLSLEKECEGRPRPGLAVGTSPGADDVVRDGASAWSTATAAQRVIPPAKEQLHLHLALRREGGAEDEAADEAQASQLLAAPRVRVTTLSSSEQKGGPHFASEVRHWQRRLVEREGHEEQLHQKGFWGLALHEAQQPGAAVPEVLSARVEGALADGGELRGAAAAAAVHFECRSRGAALVEIEIEPLPAYQPYRPAVIAFVKQCNTLTASFFDVSTRPLAPGQGGRWPAADPLKAGMAAGHLPSVGSLRSEAQVFWRSAPGGLGRPSATSVRCSDPGVVAASLEHLEQGAPINGTQTGSLWVRFQCLKAGSASCALRFAWPGKDGPSVDFRKYCGGENRAVDVESDVPGAPVVLLQGHDQPRWTLGARGGASREVVLEPNQQKAIFTVFRHKNLRPGEDAMEFGPPRVKVSDPKVVKARAIGDLADGGEVDSASEGEDLEVELQCVGAGTSQIEVSLPVASNPLLEPLVFSFAKKCDAASAQHHKWLVLGGISWVVVFLILLASLLERERRAARKRNVVWQEAASRGRDRELHSVGEDEEEG